MGLQNNKFKRVSVSLPNEMDIFFRIFTSLNLARLAENQTVTEILALQKH